MLTRTAHYFEARLEGPEVVTVGTPEVMIGHRIDLEAGHDPVGSWVEWRWDGGRLSVRNDRLGGLPVFYSTTDSSFAISPSIDRLLSLGVPRDLDFDALAAFLALGWYLDGDTPFRSIRALPPAASLTWSPGELRLDTSPPSFEPVPMSRDDAIDGVVDTVRAAIGRTIPSDRAEYVMPLSGGRDSRHLLLELIRAGHPPSRCITTSTYPSDWSDDPPYAARLSAKLELPHRSLEPGPLVAAEWRKNRMTGYATDEHAWYLPVADELDGSTSHTYDGLSGGPMLAPAPFLKKAMALADEARWDELASGMGAKQPDGQPRYAALVAPDLRDQLGGERAANRIRAGLERHLASAYPLDMFRFWSRVMRELVLTGSHMLGTVPAVYVPLMDPDVVDFSWSIPREHIDKPFQNDVIARAFPEVADVPFAPIVRPQPDRGFMRGLGRDLLALLLRGDGTLIDRSSLLRRAALTSVRGDTWFAWGRRAALTVYLVQLGAIVDGAGPEAVD